MTDRYQVIRVFGYLLTYFQTAHILRDDKQ